jgi:hypothetical protein
MKVGEYERLASALRQAGRADAAAEAYTRLKSCDYM